jgi:N6-L-threonylcarbamoyladenine synthase
VVEALRGCRILSNVVASQEAIHAQYGGVVPEVASRQHVRWIRPVIRQAMGQAAVDWDDLAAVAVTYGPGLAGSLLVGVNAAKAIAYARDLPLVAVNHMEGHIYANWLQAPTPSFPLLCLIVSGGHADLVLMTGHGQYELLGHTLDDAPGEAFDKVARILGLGYPGGPAIQTTATAGDPDAYRLPRAVRRAGYDFSFSGLKTAVLHLVRDELGIDTGKRSRGTKGLKPTQIRLPPNDPRTADLAASFQEAVVDALVSKTVAAAEEHGVKQVALAGGVAANVPLRQQMAQALSVPLLCPPISLCTDNAAMIAACGCFRYRAGHVATLDLDVVPSLRLV